MSKAAESVEASLGGSVNQVFSSLFQLGNDIQRNHQFPWEQLAAQARELSQAKLILFARVFEDIEDMPRTDDNGERKPFMQVRWVGDKPIVVPHASNASAAPISNVSPASPSLIGIDAFSLTSDSIVQEAYMNNTTKIGMVLPLLDNFKIFPLTNDLTPFVQPIAGNGVVVCFVSWHDIFQSTNQQGFQVVLRNSQNQTFTLRLGNESTKVLESGDQSDSYLSQYAVDMAISDRGTNYVFSLVPTTSFYEQYRSAQPFSFALVIAVIVIVSGHIFKLHDAVISQIIEGILEQTARTRAILEKIIDPAVRDRLFSTSDVSERDGKITINDFFFKTDEVARKTSSRNKPVAELYPHVTVMMADLAGFTSWSSSREPGQVFMLLESLYSAFDEIAASSNIFKGKCIRLPANFGLTSTFS